MREAAAADGGGSGRPGDQIYLLSAAIYLAAAMAAPVGGNYFSANVNGVRVGGRQIFVMEPNIWRSKRFGGGIQALLATFGRL